MKKIASPNELQAEVRAILAYVHGHGPDGKPDRQVVASKLRELADRVAGIPFDDPEEDKRNLQRDIAAHLNSFWRDLELSSPSMKALMGFKRDLKKGQAKAKDAKEIAGDLDFDLGQLRGKKDSKSKKQIKMITSLAAFLKKQVSKL